MRTRFSRLPDPRNWDLSVMRPRVCGEYLVAGGVFGIVAGWIARQFASQPQPYPELIVGNIAWTASQKTADYATIIGFIAGLFAMLGACSWLEGLIERHRGPAAVAAVRRIILFAVLPTAFWLGQLFLRDDPSLLWVAVSAALLLCALAIGWSVYKSPFPFESAVDWQDLTDGSLAIAAFAAMSGLALVASWCRIAGAPAERGGHLVWLAMTVGGGVALAATAWIWTRSNGSTETFGRRLRGLLLSAQLCLPMLYMTLLPIPRWLEGHRDYGYAIWPGLVCVVAGATGAAWFDLARRFKRIHSTSTILSAVSPLCVLAILIALRIPETPTPQIIGDDYHFGERLLPWWLWQSFGQVPFVDYVPARGLVSYLPGLLADTFLDGNAASFPFAFKLEEVLLLAISFVVLRRVVGNLLACIALLPVSPSPPDAVLTIALCTLLPAFLTWTPSVWLLSWMIGAGAILLIATAQGGPMILATLPLAAAAYRRAWMYDFKRLTVGTIAAFCVIAAAIVLTRLGPMMLGAGRYVIEHGAVNSIAHGIPWSNSVVMPPKAIRAFVFEAIRWEWVGVAGAAGILAWRAIALEDSAQRRRALTFALPICLLLILFTTRVAGRIDATFGSRPGLLSVWSVAVLLPIAVSGTCDLAAKSNWLLSWMFLVGTAGSLGIMGWPMQPLRGALLEPRAIAAAVSTLSPVAADTVKGADMGLPHLGTGSMNSNHLSRLRKLKATLGALVDPGETYLDMTNRNAHYFYLEYPTPIESGAFLNLPTEQQQLRAVVRLAGQPPPVALAGADNALSDAGPAAFRAHLLYRFLALHYVPVAIDDLIYMVRRDRLDRLARLPNGTRIQRDDQGFGPTSFSLLDRAFSLQDIRAVPISWGLSVGTLFARLRLVAELTPTMDHAEHAGAGTVEFDLSNFNLRGRDAGILVLRLSCPGNGKRSAMAARWSAAGEAEDAPAPGYRFDAEEGWLVVPLDASPRWLLSGPLRHLALEFPNPPCDKWSVSDVRLFQRTAVDRMPG